MRTTTIGSHDKSPIPSDTCIVNRMRLGVYVTSFCACIDAGDAVVATPLPQCCRWLRSRVDLVVCSILMTLLV
eukprot:COSAG01_NODE_3309_length_6283_cov_5.946798_5_plen_73_part_00